jgi:thiol-disulfide isomerase/thioredoxin
MIARISILCLLVSGLVLLSSGCGGRSRPEAVQVGKPAPEFELQDLGGAKVSLSQFRGKVVILDFWATWCQPCRQSMPEMEKLQEKYSSRLTLLAINLEEPADQVRSFVASEKIRSRVLLDESGTVGNAYQTTAIPMQVIIDREGIVRNVSVGGGFGLGRRLSAEIDRLLS